MSYTRHKYMDYEDLSHEELLVIAGYFLNLKMQPKDDFFRSFHYVVEPQFMKSYFDGNYTPLPAPITNESYYYRKVGLVNKAHTGEKSPDLDNLQKSNRPLSSDMRRFIDDVNAGRVAPREGTPPKTARDRDIYERVQSLTSTTVISITSNLNNSIIASAGKISRRGLRKNKKRDGAATILGNRAMIGEDAVIDVCEKIKKQDWLKDRNSQHLCVVTTHYDDNDNALTVSEGYVI